MPAPNRSKANGFWRRRIPFLSMLLALGLLALLISRSRGRNSPPIPAAGGEVFKDALVIQTPVYLQTDGRWKSDLIGGSGETIGNVGCTLCCLAMGLEPFGSAFSPKELNDALKANRGYTWRGLVRWDAIRQISAGKVTVEVVDTPSLALIDTALKNGEPVLAKVLLSKDVYHWVLIVGKEGVNYLVRDPLGDGAGVVQLSQYESDILAIRILKRGIASDHGRTP